MAKAKIDYTNMSLEQLSEALVEAKSQLDQAKVSRRANDLAKT